MDEITRNYINNTVTLPMAMYDELLEDSRWLVALQNAGVDNWNGYDFARELYNEESDE